MQGLPPAAGIVAPVPSDVATDDPAQDQPTRRSFLRRHRVATALLTVGVLVTGAAVGGGFYLKHRADQITRFDAGLGGNRPASGAGVTLLLAGVDDGQGTDLQEALEAPEWPQGALRSDTIMVLHIEADGQAAQLISIPRDSYVAVPGYGRTKINAAFSYGGPALLGRTVEQTTGIRLDHVAVVDLEGFSGITEALGGVRLPDPSRPDQLVDLEGKAALAYVRERKSLPGGDFDRIKRQQNLMRAVMQKTSDSNALANPVRLNRLIGSTVEHLAVDATLTNDRLRQLAVGNDLDASAVEFLTVPTLGTATVDGASIVRLDAAATRRLFAAVGDDRYEAWREKHDVDGLPTARQVG